MPSSEYSEQVIAALACVRIDIGDGPPMGTCLAITRIGLEVLHALDVKATALPCSLVVANPEASKAIDAYMPREQWSRRCHLIEVEAIEDAVPWDAHMVIRYGSGRNGGIVDLDLWRYARPKTGIDVGTTAVRMADPTREPCMFRTDNGTTVMWTPKPHLTGYRKTPVWTRWPESIEERLPSLIEEVRELAGP